MSLLRATSLASLLLAAGVAPPTAHAGAGPQALSSATSLARELVARAPETPGFGCAVGGQRVSLGTDQDGDGVLSSPETAVSVLVCDDALAPPALQTLHKATMPAGLFGVVLAFLVLLAVLRRTPAPVPVRARRDDPRLQ